MMTLAKISQEADVSVGSMYLHFANKDGLFLAVAERASELFADYLERAYATSESPLVNTENATAGNEGD